MMDDASSEVNPKTKEMTPLRQNIFDKSKNYCWYITQRE